MFVIVQLEEQRIPHPHACHYPLPLISWYFHSASMEKHKQQHVNAKYISNEDSLLLIFNPIIINISNATEWSRISSEREKTLTFMFLFPEQRQNMEKKWNHKYLNIYIVQHNLCVCIRDKIKRKINQLFRYVDTAASSIQQPQLSLLWMAADISSASIASSTNTPDVRSHNRDDFVYPVFFFNYSNNKLVN